MSSGVWSAKWQMAFDSFSRYALRSNIMLQVMKLIQFSFLSLSALNKIYNTEKIQRPIVSYKLFLVHRVEVSGLH